MKYLTEIRPVLLGQALMQHWCVAAGTALLVVAPVARAQISAPDSLVGMNMNFAIPGEKKGVMSFAAETFVRTGYHAGDGTYVYSKVDASHGQLAVVDLNPADLAGGVSLIDLSFTDNRSGTFVSHFRDPGGDGGDVSGTFWLEKTEGPTGEISQSISGPTNAVWDLASVEALTKRDFEVEKDGQTGVRVAYNTDFDQYGSGRLSGTGATSVTVGYESEMGWVDLPPFDGVYKVTGSIHSSHAITRARLNATVVGTTQVEGATRRLNAAEHISLVIQNTEKTITYTAKHGATAAGMGTMSDSQTLGPIPLNLVLSGEGAWVLTLTLASEGKKISGLGVATLHSSTTYPYSVKGLYNPQTDKSKLVLTGTGIAKGSSLQVTLVGNAMKVVKGKVAGQTVNVLY